MRAYQVNPIISFCCCLIACLVILTACEEPIESPVELVDPSLVITSTFAPDKLVEVRLFASQPVTGEAQVLDVKNADVRIYKGQEHLETLVYEPGTEGVTGVYKTVSFRPVVGEVYTLLASASGYTPVSAESAIPTSIPIRSLEISNLTTRMVGEYHIYDFFLTVDYDDPLPEGDFYDLRISQEVIPYRVNGVGDTTFYEVMTKGLQSPDTPINTSPAFTQASILVKDKPMEEGVQVQLQARLKPNHEILGDLIAELRTVSEPYYQFQRTIQGEGTVFGGIGEPAVNTYTNVKQGYGLFAGYSSNIWSRPLSAN